MTSVLSMSEVADAEHEVPDQAEHSGLRHLAQVHAGDADERQDGHEDLHGLADRPLGRGDEGERPGGGGLIWTRDEQQARRRRRRRRPLG